MDIRAGVGLVRGAAWVVAAGMAIMAVPDTAAAYLMDANDARTVDSGYLELEIMPVGFYTLTTLQDEEQLIVPSFMAYLGLSDDIDLLFLTRNWVRVTSAPDTPDFRTWDSYLLFRLQLIRGRYDTQDEEPANQEDGPSLALHAGWVLPNVNADEAFFGASLAFLFSWQWDVGTLHANVWVQFNPWEAGEIFAVAAMEGPPAWRVRPFVEVWYDYDGYFGSLLSGLVGGYVNLDDEGDISTLGLGVRVAGWDEYAQVDDYLEVEVRASFWFGFPDPLWGGSDGESESEPSSVSEPNPDPEPVPDPEPDPNPESAPEPVSDPEPNPNPEPTPNPEPNPEPDSADPTPDSASDPQSPPPASEPPPPTP